MQKVLAIPLSPTPYAGRPLPPAGEGFPALRNDRIPPHSPTQPLQMLNRKRAPLRRSLLVPLDGKLAILGHAASILIRSAEVRLADGVTLIG